MEESRGWDGTGFRTAFAADPCSSAAAMPSGLTNCPKGVRRGGNDDAFRGGFRLWEKYVAPA